MITNNIYVEIGDSVVRVRSHEKKGLPILFVALHDNEDTGIQAAHNTIITYGGRLIELVAINQRWIPFNVGERRVVFDPNWMFSVSGVKRSLRDYRVYSPKACRMVTSFSRRIIEELDVDRFKVVVSLHNNTNGGFSILSYGRKRRYASQVRKLHIRNHSDVDDFFLVTNIKMFRYIKMKNYNVALVKRHVVAGDGSLMGYSVEHGVDYLNIEAQHLHFSKQREMINLVLEYYQNEANHDNEHRRRTDTAFADVIEAIRLNAANNRTRPLLDRDRAPKDDGISTFIGMHRTDSETQPFGMVGALGEGADNCA